MATKSTASVAVARTTRRYVISTIGSKRGQALLPWWQRNDWRAAIFDFPTSRPSLVVILRKQWGLSPAKKVTGFGASWA